MIQSCSFRQWNFCGNVSSLAVSGLDVLSPNHYSFVDLRVISQWAWVHGTSVNGHTGNTVLLGLVPVLAAPTYLLCSVQCVNSRNSFKKQTKISLFILFHCYFFLQLFPSRGARGKEEVLVYKERRALRYVYKWIWKLCHWHRLSINTLIEQKMFYFFKGDSRTTRNFGSARSSWHAWPEGHQGGFLFVCFRVGFYRVVC